MLSSLRAHELTLFFVCFIAKKERKRQKAAFEAEKLRQKMIADGTLPRELYTEQPQSADTRSTSQ